MRILIVNKFFYNRGGDCVCAISLEQMLRLQGHETAVFAMQYAENFLTPYSDYFAPEVSFSGGIGSKLKAASRIFGGAGVKAAFARLLKDFRPDVVHFNNIHSYLSPVIVKMAKDFGAKTVWTLHDYKLVCPSYSCLSQGKVCEGCIGGNVHGVVDKRCMKGSRVASMLAYWEARYWDRRKLEAYTDAFVCPSHFMARKMEQGGFDPKKLNVVCNFVDPEKVKDYSVVKERKPYYIYVGRLSEEKGVRTLLEAASQLPYTLKIAGGGPLAEELKARYAECKNIEFLGHLNAGQVRQYLSEARFSVMPSECYENNPLSVIESLCFGTPVVGARIGGIPELISPSTGFLFRFGDLDSLKKTITTAMSVEFDNLSISNLSMERFSDRLFLDKILSVYSK